MSRPEASRPEFRSHYLPRTRNGWVGAILFLLLMIMVEPPVVHSLANRIEPWVLGVPFLYAYLFVFYILIIGVLLWALRKGL